MQGIVLNYPNLDVRAASVSDLVFDHQAVPSSSSSTLWGTVTGVRLGNRNMSALKRTLMVHVVETGDVIPCSQVVICTGTFLSGEIHIGACFV